MKLELSTELCPIIIPDTYGSGFQYECNEGMWDELKQLMIDIAERYLKENLEETDFANATLTMGEFGSPMEYNFITDWINFTLEFDDSLLETIKNTVDDNFFDYARKRFGSYNGYISFYPYYKEEFMDCLATKRKLEYIVSMYIMWQVDYVMDLDNVESDYLNEVWEYASCNTEIFMDYDDDDEAM